MYPIGSYVMLNTGEVAQVISINNNRPVRPVVKIMKTADGEDILENVEAAKKIGWDGAQFLGYENLVNEFENKRIL